MIQFTCKEVVHDDDLYNICQMTHILWLIGKYYESTHIVSLRKLYSVHNDKTSRLNRLRYSFKEMKEQNKNVFDSEFFF